MRMTSTSRVASSPSRSRPNYEISQSGDVVTIRPRIHENPADRAGATIYKWPTPTTFTWSRSRRPTPRSGSGYQKDVTVEVTNVEEEGGSMRLSAVQPQAGTSFYVIDETRLLMRMVANIATGH